MVAYVGLAPVFGGMAHRLPRRALLVGLDLARAALIACLPFVTEIWQIYLLIFLLNSCSAGFTPTFQATIPDAPSAALVLSVAVPSRSPACVVSVSGTTPPTGSRRICARPGCGVCTLFGAIAKLAVGSCTRGCSGTRNASADMPRSGPQVRRLYAWQIRRKLRMARRSYIAW